MRDRGEKFYTPSDYKPDKKTIIVLCVLGVFISIVLAAGITLAMTYPDSTPIGEMPAPTATPLPAIVNASPTVTAIVNASPTATGDAGPSPTVIPTLDDYNYWKAHNGTPILYGDPALENGNRIYVPTPTPAPTPTPTPGPVEKHTKLMIKDTALVPDGSLDATTPGILAWDPAGSTGLYPYYYEGDNAVLNLRFVSQYWKPIEKPTISITLQKQSVFGSWLTIYNTNWVSNYTVPPTYFNQDKLEMYQPLGSMVIIKEIPIPSSMKYDGLTFDAAGRYKMIVTVYADKIQACTISKELVILTP
jgi:hypothetical protein